MNDVIEELLQLCAQRADRHFRQHGDLRTYLWLTVDCEGRQVFSETPCSAPPDIDDATALAVLRDEVAADFERDGVVGFAVAYPSMVTFIGTGLAILANLPTTRRRAVTVEAHAEGHALLGVCDIIPGFQRPSLGPLQKGLVCSGKFGGLLAS